MIEFLLEVAGEFLLQAIGQALLELGLHCIAEPFRRPPDPWMAAVGYAIFGAIFGGLSLLVFPAYVMPAGMWRVANLMLVPPAVGGFMAALGEWRKRRGDSLFYIDQFFYGFLFALALALVRYFFAT